MESIPGKLKLERVCSCELRICTPPFHKPFFFTMGILLSQSSTETIFLTVFVIATCLQTSCAFFVSSSVRLPTNKPLAFQTTQEAGVLKASSAAGAASSLSILAVRGATRRFSFSQDNDQQRPDDADSREKLEYQVEVTRMLERRRKRPLLAVTGNNKVVRFLLGFLLLLTGLVPILASLVRIIPEDGPWRWLLIPAIFCLAVGTNLLVGPLEAKDTPPGKDDPETDEGS